MRFVRWESDGTTRVFQTDHGDELFVRVTKTRHGMSISEFTVESSQWLEVSTLKKLTDYGPFGFDYHRQSRSTEKLCCVHFVTAYTD